MEIIAIICLVVVVGTIVVILQLSRKLADTKSKLFASEASLTAEQSRSRELAENVTKREENIAKLTERIESLKEENVNLSLDNAKLTEKMQSFDRFRQQMEQETENRFKVLAQQILDANSKSFVKSNGESMTALLAPLRENINNFQKMLLQTHVSQSKNFGELEASIPALRQSNTSIGKEARELTEALRGNSKVQGDWGEMVLESILDKSGLIRDENYFVQMTRNPDGTIIEGENNQRLRPDVVVVLPDDKYIVIDSKVSLTAYTDYINADTEESRADAAARHVTSVRNHLKELKGKNYQDYVGIRPGKGNQIDFQLMFIPNEHAYLTALSLDKKLWQDAYDQRIVIISPAHVISTLRLVAQLWRRERQDRNAMKIAEESGKLYDKFAGFVDDMQRLQTALNTAQRSFDDAKKKLNEGRGNMFSKFEELKTLGARANKQLPTAND